MNAAENYRRAVLFENPDWIPATFYINPACYAVYPQGSLEELMAEHPLLFPDYQKPDGPTRPVFRENQNADAPYTDDWGCTWQTSMSGITGAVIEHPLADWDALDDFTPPDPATSNGVGPFDWEKYTEQVRQAKADGGLPNGHLEHGHLFLRLTYLRGYENILFDMIDDEPRLWKLIEMVEAFSAERVRRFIEAGAEMVGYPEDLGMQVGPMLAPEQLRKWIKPSYTRLMQQARDAGCLIHMHSDGDIRDLVDDLVVAGVQVVNLQDLVNGLDWIAENLRGRVCIDLDIDRQKIIPHGTPAEIDAHVKNCVETLARPEGGLILRHGVYPGVPLENIRATMDAFEKYVLKR